MKRTKFLLDDLENLLVIKLARDTLNSGQGLASITLCDEGRGLATKFDDAPSRGSRAALPSDGADCVEWRQHLRWMRIWIYSWVCLVCPESSSASAKGSASHEHVSMMFALSGKQAVHGEAGSAEASAVIASQPRGLQHVDEGISESNSRTVGLEIFD